MENDFDFKPLNEGLGFHRKPTHLDDEPDMDDRFALKDLAPGQSGLSSDSQFEKNQAQSLIDDSKSGSKSSFGSLFTVAAPPLGNTVGSLPTKSTGSAAATATGTAAAGTSTPKVPGAKHNTKGVSDLIAALPPTLDFFSEAERAQSDKSTGLANSESLGQGANALFSKSKSNSSAASAAASSASAAAAALTGAIAGRATAASNSTSGTAASAAAGKKSLIRMPVGRDDYKKGAPASTVAAAGQSAPLTQPGFSQAASAAAAQSAQAATALDQNLAKAFPHLGRLAGQSASASSLMGLMQTQADLEKSVDTEKPIAVHFGSIVLDALVSLGLGCILLAISLGITNANLMALLENSQTDVQTMVLLGVLFMAGGLLYVIGSRSFLGATLGEWSYEVRVGEKSRRDRWFYPILVLWRGALVAATGFIVLPLISAIVGRDVLGYLTGLKTVGISGQAE